MKAVLVKWRDIASWVGWNDDLLDNQADEPPTFYTIGFLVRKTKTKITISDTHGVGGNITVFPAGCIEELKEIDCGTPKAVRKRKAT
jgi:hypothetical protein